MQVFQGGDGSVPDNASVMSLTARLQEDLQDRMALLFQPVNPQEESSWLEDFLELGPSVL